MTDSPQKMKIDTGRSSAGWSSYGCFRKCPRKFAYENRNSIEGKRGGARGLGSLVHGLLADHYVKIGQKRDGIVDEHPETAEETARELAQDFGVDDEDRDLALTRYREYCAHYRDDPWSPVTVEVEHKIGFLVRGDRIEVVEHGTEGSVPYTSRIDLVAKDRQGKVWIVDHKTAAKIRWDTKTRYGVSGQMHGFHWIGRFFYGEAFAGVMLNLIQTRAGVEFKRVRPVAAPKMVENFPRLVIHTAGEIAKLDAWAQNIEDWPTSANETVCVSTYGLCDHADRCRFGG